VTEPEDWRLRGQQAYLHGIRLRWRRYGAWSATWDHDHCDFCWAKFIPAELVDDHREASQDEHRLLSEGYTTTSEYERGADYVWVCSDCFNDFKDQFDWVTVD
jgi:hypothetical protein